jgi:hypothetical protein
MASDLLNSWLSNEVGLSRKISHFETDFSNGYLFGELLFKFTQIDNFHLFRNKYDRSSVVNNWCKLEPVLKTLGVKFNTQMINSIIKKDKGISLRLL